jgi:hypothetical protein
MATLELQGLAALPHAPPWICLAPAPAGSNELFKELQFIAVYCTFSGGLARQFLVTTGAIDGEWLNENYDPLQAPRHREEIICAICQTAIEMSGNPLQ